MRISLRQLAVFEAVARHESVSRGADDVAISQSAASMAIKELEEALGISLFHRQGRKLTINENGRRLQPMARSLLAQAQEIERISPTEELTGVLRIAATDTVTDYVLGPICGRFLKQHPGVQIKLEPTPWQQVLIKVESMACDLGFAEAPCNRSGLIFEPILSDEMVVFTAPQHPLAARGQIDVSDLARERWCLRGVGSGGRHKLTLGFASVSPGISIAFESDSTAAVKAAVTNGLGLGCLSRRALNDEFAAKLLVPLDVRGLPLDRVFGMVRPRNVYRGVLQESFSALVRDFADRHIASRFKSSTPGVAQEVAELIEPINKLDQHMAFAPLSGRR